MGIEADLSERERHACRLERDLAYRLARLVSKERLSGSDALNAALAAYDDAVVARRDARQALSDARSQRARDAYARKRSRRLNGEAAPPQ
jgi:exonuclease VII small subunit